jgi:hypothetical protein
MSDDRQFERTARAWLELGPTDAPDHAVEGALLTIETTAQERDLRIPWRLPKMNPIVRTAGVAAVAIVAVVAVAGAVNLLRLPVSQFGGRTPGPASVEGTWDVTYTRQEMLAAGLTDSTEDSAANYGHFKLDLHGGTLQLFQLTPPQATESGWYTVSGSTLTVTLLSREPFSMQYTVSDTTLTIGRGGPVYLHVKPWTRIGP